MFSFSGRRKLCHRIGTTLTPYWQSIAIMMAGHCQYDGKTLPTAWQNTVNSMAKHCQKEEANLFTARRYKQV